MVTYPILLESSIFRRIIALSDTEIGKIPLPNPYVWVNAKTGEPAPAIFDPPTLEHQVQLLQQANQINDLLPRFLRQETWTLEDDKTHPMLVLERLYPLPIHHFPLKVRRAMFDVFENELQKLHLQGWIHGDFMRPTHYRTRNDFEWMFKHIVQTETKLRLLDTRFSMRYSQQERERFMHLLQREKAEIQVFKNYYLSKPPKSDA